MVLRCNKEQVRSERERERDEACGGVRLVTKKATSRRCAVCVLFLGFFKLQK